MAFKSSSPGPNPATAPAVKQGRSRKAANASSSKDPGVGRAGSAGGIMLEKEHVAKPSVAAAARPSTTKVDTAQDTDAQQQSKTRRRPRKLNKEPTSSTSQPTTISSSAASAAANAELEALKSRVRGLEAKVEQLYNAANTGRQRSPRRRGKGRKGSSATQVPTLSTTTAQATDAEPDHSDEEIDDEELVRLEGELEVARQDLASYRPRARRTTSKDTDDVEEIPRDGSSSAVEKRHVTLSGSYRIPLPTSVSMDDVKTIQSGVSAAQNVARSFLEQRRAAAAQRETAGPTSPKPRSKPPTPRAMSSSMEVSVKDDGKQSWSEWIGGYSVAISRAVKNIEHEAAMESQRAGGTGAGSEKAGAKGGGAPGKKGKRPSAKANLSSEQVHGLMS